MSFAGAAVLLVTGVCRADANDAVARCAASESKDERIACLENALQAAGPAGTSAPEPAPTPPPKPAVAVPPEPAQPEPAPPGGTFGAEQLEQPESRTGDDEVLKATVTDFDFVGYRRLLVKLDNGQVWRQIDGDRTNVKWGLRDQTTFDVELWEAAFGGYRMRVMPVDRVIRVERVK